MTNIAGTLVHPRGMAARCLTYHPLTQRPTANKLSSSVPIASVVTISLRVPLRASLERPVSIDDIGDAMDRGLINVSERNLQHSAFHVCIAVDRQCVGEMERLQHDCLATGFFPFPVDNSSARVRR